MIFIKGLFYGIGVSFLLGTVFFALLKYGRVWGSKAGMAIALGVVFSDLIFISLVLIFRDVSESFITESKHLLFSLGGILLIFLGIGQWLTKEKEEKAYSAKNVLQLVSLGFILNISNPVNFFIWLGIQSSLTLQGYVVGPQLVFLSASLLGIFIGEVTIAAISKHLLRALQGSFLRIFKTSIALLFVGSGVFLLLKALLQQ